MHEIYDAERTRRVLIFQRNDGKWSFTEEYFSAHEFEQCWIPENRGVSVCDSSDTALHEAVWIGSSKVR